MDLSEASAAVDAAKLIYDQALEARRVAVIEAYRSGETLQQIAQAGGLTAAGAAKILAQAGIARRPKGGDMRSQGR